MAGIARSHATLDLRAIRANTRTLRRVLGRTELWAVVKADGYGHGAVDVGRVALEEGATALCVASVPEALVLRAVAPGARLIVLGPTPSGELEAAREARLELVVGPQPLPDDIPVHVKVDSGMGRWGLAELPAPGRNVVGVMTHFADADGDEAFTRLQLRRFLDATAGLDNLTRHAANSAASFTVPEAHLDAARCGIALYGISPFGDDPGRFGLVPALRWESEVAAVKQLSAGASTGYGRRFVATEPTWIALVPVGYADGFRRDMTGTEVLVGGMRRPVVGTVSMDVIAVTLPAPVDMGTPVTLIGDGVHVEEHARAAGTIAYELVCRLETSSPRATRTVVDE